MSNKLKDGVILIYQERARQIADEGWTADHDDGHDDGELARMAAYYTLLDTNCKGLADRIWPFINSYPNPKDQIRNLVRAGALIAAEIDRLQRIP